MCFGSFSWSEWLPVTDLVVNLHFFILKVIDNLLSINWYNVLFNIMTKFHSNIHFGHIAMILSSTEIIIAINKNTE